VIEQTIRIAGRIIMFNRGPGLAIALVLAWMPLMAAAGLVAAADAKYPNLKGQWIPLNAPGPGGHGAAFDPTRPAGAGQQAPLTPEYQQIFADSLADQARGGIGNDQTAQCFAAGMPRMMGYEAQEYIVKPNTTYIVLGSDDNLRRINTDGRDWPKALVPTWQGYSIGHWIDEDADGTYDVLEVETHGPFKGPRAYDATGLPLHRDNDSTFKERFFLDKADPNLLHDVITVIDRALTRPWTVDKTFRRNPDPQPDWPEIYCNVTNDRLVLGDEAYRLDAERVLMPVRKDQPPPDLRYFTPSAK
jgi:hypothetical protein